jgi:hypothetical protein
MQIKTTVRWHYVPIRNGQNPGELQQQMLAVMWSNWNSQLLVWKKTKQFAVFLQS